MSWKVVMLCKGPVIWTCLVMRSVVVVGSRRHDLRFLLAHIGMPVFKPLSEIPAIIDFDSWMRDSTLIIVVNVDCLVHSLMIQSCTNIGLVCLDDCVVRLRIFHARS